MRTAFVCQEIDAERMRDISIDELAEGNEIEWVVSINRKADEIVSLAEQRAYHPAFRFALLVDGTAMDALERGDGACFGRVKSELVRVARVYLERNNPMAIEKALLRTHGQVCVTAADGEAVEGLGENSRVEAFPSSAVKLVETDKIDEVLAVLHPADVQPFRLQQTQSVTENAPNAAASSDVVATESGPNRVEGAAASRDPQG